jgi:hypothetical protein
MKSVVPMKARNAPIDVCPRSMTEETATPTVTILEVFDLAIATSALALQIDPDASNFAMLAALAAARRLGISDASAYQIRDSALAEIWRTRGGDG